MQHKQYAFERNVEHFSLFLFTKKTEARVMYDLPIRGWIGFY